MSNATYPSSVALLDQKVMYGEVWSVVEGFGFRRDWSGFLKDPELKKGSKSWNIYLHYHKMKNRKRKKLWFYEWRDKVFYQTWKN